MIVEIRRILFGVSAALILSGTAAANNVRELSWDELLPESASLQQLQPPPGHGAGNPDEEEWDWEEDSFEEAFATPVFPAGVVEELDGERVKLPGFIVPLEIADNGKVGEFLLVPYFGACIHYPAPPPNQIVYVTMPEPIEVESMWDPVWVTGEIRTESRHSELASAGYSMTAQTVEDYEY